MIRSFFMYLGIAFCLLNGQFLRGQDEADEADEKVTVIYNVQHGMNTDASEVLSRFLQDADAVQLPDRGIVLLRIPKGKQDAAIKLLSTLDKPKRSATVLIHVVRSDAPLESSVINDLTGPIGESQSNLKKYTAEKKLFIENKLQVTIMDGIPSELYFGSRVAFSTQTRAKAQGSYTVEFIETGTTAELLGRITESGVVLSLQLEKSELLDRDGDDTNPLPSTSVLVAQSTIKLTDAKTELVGLMEENSAKDSRRSFMIISVQVHDPERPK